MTFPHISQCLHLISVLKADNYQYIVEEQPIGKELFRQFCVAFRKNYTFYLDFLVDVDNYETELEEQRVGEAQKIFSKYLNKPQGRLSVTVIDLLIHI